METDKRRFLPGEGLKRISKKYDYLTPDLDDDHVRVAHKIREMTVEEIKGRIPRVIYSGILLAADQLYNDGLRSNDAKKRKEASAAFLANLGSANFLKNLSVLASGDDEREKNKPKTVAWGNEEKSK